MCKYCDINKAKKYPGIPFGVYDTTQLYISYDDCDTEDEKEHFQIVSTGRHITAFSVIKYCPFCGRKLE
jgi:NADH pyrophosphatase NudC (nudix superfamily)